MPRLGDLPPPEASVIVPLRWETRLQLEGTEFELANTALTAKHQAYEALIKESALSFEEYATSHDEIIARYNSMMSFCAILAARTISHIIRETLSGFQPRKVWVPANCLYGTALVKSQEWEGIYDFCDALRYIVLREGVAHEPVNTFREHPEQKTIWSNPARNLSKTEIFLLVVAKVLKSTRKLICRIPGRYQPGKNKLPIHVIGQPSKTKNLLSELDGGRVPYVYLPDVPVQGPNSALKISYQISSAHALQAYLNFRNQNLKDIEPQVKDWSTQIKVGLLTDHDFDPKTRVVLNEISKKGLFAAVFPEGIMNFQASLKPIFESSLWNKPGIQHFTVSDYASQYLDKHYSLISKATAGYFARRSSKSVTRMIQLLKPFRVDTRIRILVSLELYKSHLAIWEEHEYQSTMKLLETLSSLKHKVIIKGRHAHMNALLAKRFPKLKFYNYVPWYLLAQMSDVVIHSDSSIGLEALSIGKPVIVWKPFDYPMLSDAYSDLPTDVVRKVTRGEDLETAIEELVQSPKKDFDKYEHFLAHEHHRVIDWAKNAVRRSLVT